MSRFIARLKWYLESALGFDRLGPEMPALCRMYTVYLVIWSLQTVFINTLLYRVTGRSESVLYFNLQYYFFCALFMTMGASLLKRTSPLVVVRVGAAAFIVMYGLLFFAADRADRFIFPLALAYGAGMGFYWIGHNTMITAYTTPSNRDVGIGLLCILQGVMTLVVPLISGFVIAWFDGLEGYYLMFGAAMVSAVAIMLLTARLAPAEIKDRRNRFKLALTMVRTHITTRLMLATEFFRGIRDGAFAFYFNLLLYQIIQDEALIGVNTLLTGVASIVAAWAYGKLVMPGNRARWVAIATTVLLAASLPLLWRMNPWMLFIAAIINGFFNFFIVNPATTSSYDVMGATVVSQKCLTEMLSIREWSMCFGRMLGIILILLIPKTELGSVLAILILTGSQYFVALGIMVNGRILKRKSAKAAAGGSV